MDDVESDESSNLDLIDNLIKKYCIHFENKIDENAKIGDLFRMFELRRKLSPENSDQKKFWKMINKIRHDNLKTETSNDSMKVQEKNEK